MAKLAIMVRIKSAKPDFYHDDDLAQVVDNGHSDPVEFGQFCSLDCFPGHC